ncbi:MAG: hypothetical protein RSA90_06685 [Lachnospiraceae bacterium]
MNRIKISTFTMLVVLITLSGCSTKKHVDDSSPIKVVKTVVTAYQNKEEKIVRACYNKPSNKECLEQEILFESQFFEVVAGKDIYIIDAEKLIEIGSYTYVGISYDFILKNGISVPYYEYFLTVKEGKKYKIVASEDYPADIREQIKNDQEKIQSSNLFQVCKERENKFNKIDDKYMANVYKDWITLSKTSKRPEINHYFIFILIMAGIELGSLMLWSMFRPSSYKKRSKAKGKRKIKQKH